MLFFQACSSLPSVISRERPALNASPDRPRKQTEDGWTPQQTKWVAFFHSCLLTREWSSVFVAFHEYESLHGVGNTDSISVTCCCWIAKLMKLRTFSAQCPDHQVVLSGELVSFCLLVQWFGWNALYYIFQSSIWVSTFFEFKFVLNGILGMTFSQSDHKQILKHCERREF